MQGTQDQQQGLVAQLQVRANDADYLSDPAVSAYFDAREHDGYYSALKRVGLRRDFHARLIPVLERYVDLTEHESCAASVDRVMALDRACRDHAGTESPLTIARASQPRGVELLGLSDPLTYETLKVAYRVAVRSNHPDVGGQHEAMVEVNEAFGLIHGLLRHEQIAESGGDSDPLLDGGDEPENSADYRYLCGERLLRVSLDDWNVDAAAGWLVRVTSPEWQEAPCALYRRRWIRLAGPASQLASRLSVAGRSVEAHRCLDVAHAALRVAQAEGLCLEAPVRDAEDVIAGRKRLQVVIKHPRQAEFARRLGIIDENRYRKVLEKFDSEATAREALDAELARLLLNSQFLSALPRDLTAQSKVVKTALVPAPGYFVARMPQLTDDQQAEYLEAFRGTPNLARVRKYTFVRLVSLLESVLLFPNEVDATAAAREATVLGTLHEGAGANYASRVSTVIAELAAQSQEERRERAACLTPIIGGPERSCDGVQANMPTDSSPLDFPLSDSYLRAITRPVHDLRALKRFGTLPLSDEEARERRASARDAETLRASAVQVSQRAAHAAIKSARADPDGAIAAWGQHCELLLTLGQTITHVEDLQLGYWVDKITAALVRVKRWGEARAWLERYFELDARYRERSCVSEDVRLQKRLARICEKNGCE